MFKCRFANCSTTDMCSPNWTHTCDEQQKPSHTQTSCSVLIGTTPRQQLVCRVRMDVQQANSLRAVNSIRYEQKVGFGVRGKASPIVAERRRAASCDMSSQVLSDKHVDGVVVLRESFGTVIGKSVVHKETVTIRSQNTPKCLLWLPQKNFSIHLQPDLRKAA